MGSSVIAHGGSLLNLYLGEEEIGLIRSRFNSLASWSLTPRQLCDIELLLCGAFSPLTGFNSRSDYDQILSEMRLVNGLLWPMPINLDVDENFAAQVSVGEEIVLRDAEGVAIALLSITDKWQPDKSVEAKQVYGTLDESHPGVYYLFKQSHSWYLGGTLTGVCQPLHYAFRSYRNTPINLREFFDRENWQNVLSFQTRNPIHKAHVILTKRLMAEHDAKLVIHAAVGLTKPGDIDVYCRVRCYERILSYYPKDSAKISLLPLAMRMAGPREALWHAIIRQNYGFSHFLVGRDHAGPGRDNRGGTFYGVEDSQALVLACQEELKISIIALPFLLYSPSRGEFCESDKLLTGENGLYLSGAELRQTLTNGEPVPDWFSFPEVIEELHRSLPPKPEIGFTVFFTGLSGSGKSTLANGLVVKLRENGKRRVTLLDGDVVRKHLSNELNFSKEHRDINVKRIGFVASEITKNGGIAICAPIAPFADARNEVKKMVSEAGIFVEVHVSTPLEICEARDRKGLYALAREGKIKQFTGINDPYEIPEKPAIRINTAMFEMEAAVDMVYQKLVEIGVVE